MTKLQTTQEKANAKRRRIYAYVRNQYGSSAIAKTASGLSYAELYARYGIELSPTRTAAPKLVVYNKAQRSRRVRYYENYKQLVNFGYDPGEANKRRARKPKQKIIGGGDGATRWYDRDFNVIDERGRPIKRREDQWRIWSRYANYKKDDPRYNKISFPPLLEKIAARFNLESGFDPNAKYGYSKMWLIWVAKYSPDEATQIINVDKTKINNYAYIADYHINN